MLKSVLTRNQKQTFTKMIKFEGKPCKMTVNIRYDDECNNGHNTFSITGTINELGVRIDSMICAGCIHEEIKKYFPEFKHLIKWHLCSSDGPMYYMANTKYWVKNNNIANAKKSAIWGVTSQDTDNNLKLLDDEVFLMGRLPFLLKAFKKDIEALNFKY